MTKDEVLQKVNDYCTEKAYTTETLTQEFKDKFVTFFFKRHENDAIDDEGVVADLQFSLNTAFSAASKVITNKQTSFQTEKAELERQIEELKKKVNPTPKPNDIPQEIKEKLERLERFETEQRETQRRAEVIKEAKKKIRTDLHRSFDAYVKDRAIDANGEVNTQAEALVKSFSEVFKDSIGDIRPFVPSAKTEKQEQEFIDSIPKVKI